MRNNFRPVALGRGLIEVRELEWDEKSVCVSLRSAVTQKIVLRSGLTSRELALPAGETVTTEFPR